MPLTEVITITTTTTTITIRLTPPIGQLLFEHTSFVVHSHILQTKYILPNKYLKHKNNYYTTYDSKIQ